MQLTPRYDGPPVLRIEGPTPGPAAVLLRQRRRLVDEVLARFRGAVDGLAADAVVLEGPAVDLLEGLSLRAPLPCAVAADDRWILAGLGTVFDQPDRV